MRITQLFGLTAFLLLVSTSADGLDLETALAERVLGEAGASVTVVLTGTPSFIINGELYVGGRPIGEFAQLIEPLLALG